MTTPRTSGPRRCSASSWSAQIAREVFTPEVAVQFGRQADLMGDLWPQESAQLGWAVPRRRREFAAVRTCARMAFGQLGVPEAAVLNAPDRSPCWPAGVVGSLAHDSEYALAAIARQGRITSLGVDLESNEPLPEGVVEHIAGPDECTRARTALCADSVPPGGAVSWSRLLFSAKESIFKAWYPLTGIWLDFSDCQLRLDAANQRFFGEVQADLGQVPAMARRCYHLAGRWTLAADQIVTGVVIAAGEMDRRQSAVKFVGGGSSP